MIQTFLSALASLLTMLGWLFLTGVIAIVLLAIGSMIGEDTTKPVMEEKDEDD